MQFIVAIRNIAKCNLIFSSYINPVFLQSFQFIGIFYFTLQGFVHDVERYAEYILIMIECDFSVCHRYGYVNCIFMRISTIDFELGKYYRRKNNIRRPVIRIKVAHAIDAAEINSSVLSLTNRVVHICTK